MRRGGKFAGMLIFLLSFLFISFPNTNAQTSNGGMEKSDFIPLVITITFLGIVIWDGVYKEWIKNKVKEKERIFKISFFSIAGIILFSLGVPIWKRLIPSLLYGEPLAFFPFIFISLIFSIALLISFMDKRVYAAFFCCMCIIIIAINFYDEVVRWDMFPLALLFYCLSSFAPAWFFSYDESKQSYQILKSGFSSSFLFTLSTFFILQSLFPEMIFQKPEIFFIFFWTSSIAFIISFSAVILLHNGILFFLNKKRVSEEGEVSYVREGDAIDLINFLRIILYFSLGIFFFTMISNDIVKIFSLPFMENLSFSSLSIFIFNAGVFMIGALIAYIDSPKNASFFSLAPIFVFPLRFFPIVHQWDFFLFSTAVYTTSSYITMQGLSKINWSREKFWQTAKIAIIISLLFSISIISFQQAFLPAGEFLNINDEIFIKYISLVWISSIISPIIFLLIIETHEIILFALNGRREREDGVKYSINFDAKKFGKTVLIIALSSSIFFLSIHYFHEIAFLLDNDGSISLNPLLISAILFSIIMILSYSIGKKYASIACFTGFLIIFLFGQRYMRLDFHAIATACFIGAAYVPSWNLTTSRTMKEAISSIFWSSIASCLLLFFIPLFYLFSSHIKELEVISLDISTISALLWFSFISLFIIFMSFYFIHEGITFAMGKKRVLTEEGISYLNIEKANEIMKSIAAEKKPILPKKIMIEPEKVKRCTICLGMMKPNTKVIECKCGEIFHESCAKRVGNCPNCDAPIGEGNGNLEG